MDITAYVVSAAGRCYKDKYGYTHCCPVYTGLTASGKPVTPETAAVDTRIFPFGTKLRIPGDRERVATDTGGLIVGHTIDRAVYSCKEAIEWGRKRNVLIAYELPH